MVQWQRTLKNILSKGETMNKTFDWLVYWFGGRFLKKEKKTYSLVGVYDLFCKHIFVKELGTRYEDKRHQYLMTKIEVEVPVLGKVILATAYSDKWRSRKAVPILFLTEAQINELRHHGIHFMVRKLDTAKTEYVYFRTASRELLERIDAL